MLLDITALNHASVVVKIVQENPAKFGDLRELLSKTSQADKGKILVTNRKQICTSQLMRIAQLSNKEDMF